MKTKTILFTFFLVGTLLLVPVQPGAAQAAALSLHLEQADLTAFPQVSVRLSAWDATGLPVAGLSPADFTLQEDGAAPFHPTSVQADANAPLNVVLVLDISGSMAGQPISDAKAAATRFLDKLTRRDRAALIAFNDTVNPDPTQLDPNHEIGFTTNLTPIYDLIDSLQASGDTHIYDAMVKAVKLAAALPAGHRAILLLSDGQNQPPTQGDSQQAITLAQAANLPIFIIGLGNEIDQPYLSKLANDTGGLFRLAPKSSELASLFTDMASLLKTQYILTYPSSLPADGKSHTLLVTLNSLQGSANASQVFGPLPAAADTPTPLSPTATTVSPAPTLVPSPVPTLAPEPPSFLAENWGWLLAAVIALVLALWFTARSTRHPHPKKEACAQCGFDLTGISGACPQCGGTKRLPKR